MRTLHATNKKTLYELRTYEDDRFYYIAVYNNNILQRTFQSKFYDVAVDRACEFLRVNYNISII